VAVLYAKSNVVVARGSARKAIELLAGNYDVEIGSIPSQIKKEVRVDAGKETSLDLGPSGALIVRVVDSAGKKVRGSAKVKKAEGGELVASPSVNTQIDIMPGRYTVELAREPLQIKNDVNIGADEVTTVEFVIQTPASPPKPAQAVSIKKPGE
jgi:uncharacterized membrane protein